VDDEFESTSPVNEARLPPASAHLLLGQTPCRLDLTKEASSETDLLKTEVHILTHKMQSIYIHMHTFMTIFTSKFGSNKSNSFV